MLALTRWPGECVVVDGPAIIRIVKCRQTGEVRLAFESDAKVLRSELLELEEVRRKNPSCAELWEGSEMQLRGPRGCG